MYKKNITQDGTKEMKKFKLRMPEHLVTDPHTPRGVSGHSVYEISLIPHFVGLGCQRIVVVQCEPEAGVSACVSECAPTPLQW